ncbi:hypothetical protein E0K89_009190 [Aquicoccus sp. SCR17]|nr:hypothetical protein [Carideicomes alvinocaridis]
MVGSSKILTVSYGTFSCTLEGFDDSFDTMKAIAEYFRDLAADDRYFGAEPPQPDADMLTRIAEREIARRVEAREENGAFHLRAAALGRPEPEAAAEREAVQPTDRPAPAGEAYPDDTAAAAAPAEPSAPYAPAAAPRAASTAGAENVAAKLRRIRAVVAKSDRAPEPLYVEDDEYDPYGGFEVNEILGTDHAPAPSEAPAEETAENSEEDAEARYEAPEPQEAAAPDTGAEEVPAAPSDEQLDVTGEVAPDVDAPASEAEEADTPTIPEPPTVNEAPAPRMGRIEEVVAAQDRLLSDPGLHDAPLDQDDALHPDPGAQDETQPTARRVKMRRKEAEAEAALAPDTEAALAAEAKAALVAEAEAGLVTETEAALEEEDRASDAVQDAPAEPAPEEVTQAETDEEEDETREAAAGLQSSLTPEQEAELARELAEVEAELRAEAEAAMAETSGPSAAEENEWPEEASEPAATVMAEQEEDAQPEEDTAQEDAAEVEDIPETADEEDEAEARDSAIRERIASRLKAAREDEMPSAEQLRSVERGGAEVEGDEAVTEPAPASRADQDVVGDAQIEETRAEDDLAEDDGAEEVEAEERHALLLQQADEHSLAQPPAEDIPPAAETPEAAEGAATQEAPERTEAAQPAPEEDESSDGSLASQIRQLAKRTVRLGGEGRALLTARSVEDESSVSRLMTETEGKMDEPEVGRRRNAIQHLRAAVAATKAEQELTRDQPDSDGSEVYRDDLASVVRPRRPGGPAEGEHRPAPLKLVAEQRIDEPKNAAPVQPRRVARPTLEEVSAAEGGGFPAYAEELGAHRLPDLLEAAASYLTFVEGREVFSRPQLMTKVRLVQGDAWSREDGLRTFGQLLREGKLVKIRGGRFSVSEEIGFRPDERAAG